MKEILKINIPEFNEYIRIAEKKILKPFIKDGKKKIPKKYQSDIYEWNKIGKLVFKDTKQLVPSNPLTVGKPRDWRINGQDIYNQKVKHSNRGALMQKMHEKFRPYLEGIKFDDNIYPLTLKINFYVLDNNKQEGRERNIDNDNRWIYNKVIQDTLVELKVIPDDNPYYINGNQSTTYFVEDPKDVRLEIILGKDEE